MRLRTPFTIAMISAALLFSNLSRAEEFGVSLMRPDSLAGWNHGDVPAGEDMPEGWKISAGCLSGTSASTPLLSGFTAGDCELRLKWSVSDGGAWKIFMPKVPNGPNLELILSEGADCGRITNGGEVLFSGAKIGPLKDKDKMHTATIVRRGTRLSISADGEKLGEARIPAGRYGLGLAVARGQCRLADLRGEEPRGDSLIGSAISDNWIDETALPDWLDNRKPTEKTGKKKEGWSIEGDELVLKPYEIQFLESKKEYGNFVLRFQCKMRKRGNSGMAIRTPRGGWPSGDGMEMQICDSPGPIDHHSYMSVYGNVAPLAIDEKADEWNDVVIKADGWMVSGWVNGQLVQNFNTLHHAELKHRHLKGWIGPQDHGAWVRFRNMYILEAPDGTGLDAWNKPKPPRAATVMVDRLMNTETLSKKDGITSGVVTARIEGDKSTHTIADLKGPGAVVRVFHSGPSRGTLSFYFDGMMEPGIECGPDELWKQATPLNKDRSPVVTYLPYKKSLRIVLRGANKADYRIDYVNFPSGLPIKTFSGPRTTVPRGWLGPPNYRQHVAHWGVHREHDPQFRIISEKKSISPGESAVLAHVDGAGLVRWVKLLAWDEVLQNNGLWLSATIDGEDRPAISAPVRFWFPGFADTSKNNYYNYLLMKRGGATNLLAMPFADGITITAENRGKHTVDDVGIDLSIEKATEQTRADIVARARLRGIFLPAEKNAKQLFREEGRGRWVGLVCQVPKDGPVEARLNLTVDGQPMKNWKNTSFSEFLGMDSVGFRRCLSGRQNGLAWRYMLLAPVDFHESIQLDATAGGVGGRLALFYLYK